MAQRKYSVEQIIVKLREIELLCNQGKTIAEAARQAGITEQTYYRWRKDYGGMNSTDAKRMKELEKENARLKKLVADLSLDNAILRDVNLKTSEPGEAKGSCRLCTGESSGHGAAGLPGVESKPNCLAIRARPIARRG